MGFPPVLRGYRALVVEDNFLIALAISDVLADNGCEVIGPVSRLALGLELAADQAIGGAFLDVNLGGEYCFPLAGRLRDRGGAHRLSDGIRRGDGHSGGFSRRAGSDQARRPVEHRRCRAPTFQEVRALSGVD
jgi:hypothetical protein